MKEYRPASARLRELEACYANSLHVGYNAAEFVLEFSQSYSGLPERIQSRLVTAPMYVRAFIEVLDRALSEYEGKYGCFEEDGTPHLAVIESR